MLAIEEAQEQRSAPGLRFTAPADLGDEGAVARRAGRHPLDAPKSVHLEAPVAVTKVRAKVSPVVVASAAATPGAGGKAAPTMPVTPTPIAELHPSMGGKAAPMPAAPMPVAQVPVKASPTAAMPVPVSAGVMSTASKRISIIAPAEDSSPPETARPSRDDDHASHATMPPDAQMPAPSLDSNPGMEALLQPEGSGEKRPGLPDDGEIPGSLIRELRESLGLTLDGLAEATKIRKAYLRAVEEEDVSNLPARVYLRGFLTQVARVLKVDRARLAEGYLLTVERASRTVPPST
jgi:hypothetical protein